MSGRGLRSTALAGALWATLGFGARFVAAEGQPNGTPAQEPGPASKGPAPDDRIAKVRERRKSLELELLRMRQQEKSLLGEVERLELEVRVRGEQLRELQLDQQRTNERLDATVKRLREIERQIERNRPLLATRARTLYKLGELSYVRLLLSVDRPSDLFYAYRLVTQLARRDNQRFASFRAELLAQAGVRRQLEQHTQDALLLRAAVEKARRAQDAERRKKTQLLTEVVQKKEVHAQYVQELAQAEARLGRLLEGLGPADVELPVAAFRGSLAWPVTGRLRIPFGRRRDPRFDTYTLHNGIEILAPPDTPVHAVHEGSVVYADRFRGYGLLVVLDHGNKHHTLYAHLGEIVVERGQQLAAGAIVGTTGSGLEGTGLYFEVRFQGKPEDPLDWLGPQRK